MKITITIDSSTGEVDVIIPDGGVTRIYPVASGTPADAWQRAGWVYGYLKRGLTPPQDTLRAAMRSVCANGFDSVGACHVPG